MPFQMKLQDPRNTKRRVYFTCVDAAALTTRLQSSDMSGTFTCYLSKNGGTPATSTNQPVQIDATNQKGLFYLELTAAEINTIGSVAIKISNTGGTKTMEPREMEVEVVQAYFATAATGTLTTSSFTSDRAEANNFWKDCLVIALTGALSGQVKKVGAFTNSGGLFTLTSGFVFTAAPANGDIFEILDR
jgi:hypothetical protein